MNGSCLFIILLRLINLIITRQADRQWAEEVVVARALVGMATGQQHFSNESDDQDEEAERERNESE